MESSPSQETLSAPDKRTRLAEIFKIISNAQPASTAKEANKLVTRAFDKVENKYSKYDVELMASGPIIEQNTLQYNGRKIYYQIYRNHGIFYGENGSIDVRRISESNPPTDKTLKEQSYSPLENMAMFFEKPGADGEKVWG